MELPEESAVSAPAPAPPEAQRSAGWILLVNLCLVCLFFLQLHWYIQNIYPLNPWIPFVSLNQINTAVDLIWGAFMLHLGTPLAKGWFELLRDPARYLKHESLGIFCNWKALAVTSVLVGGVYAAIVLQPTLHLVRTPGGAQPVIEVGGTPRSFEGDAMHLLGGKQLLLDEDVIVTGRHSLYRVKILPADAEGYWPFVSHARVDLDGLYLAKDLDVTLLGSTENRVASFRFAHQSSVGVGRHCAVSGFSQHLGMDGAECEVLLRSVLDDMAGNSEARLWEPSSGSVRHGQRAYFYDYALGPSLRLSIQQPAAKSLLANNPGNALALFRSAERARRDRLIAEFQADVGSLSSAELGRVFAEIFRTKNLYGDLAAGSTTQKLDTLAFAQEVLTLGVDHVTADAAIAFVTHVFNTILTAPPDEKAVIPALDAVLAMSRGRASLRSEALRNTSAFVSGLGEEHSSTMLAVAKLFLGQIDDGSTLTEVEGVAGVLAALRQGVRKNGPVIKEIKSLGRLRTAKLSNQVLIRPIRRALDL